MNDSWFNSFQFNFSTSQQASTSNVVSTVSSDITSTFVLVPSNVTAGNSSIVPECSITITDTLPLTTFFLVLISVYFMIFLGITILKKYHAKHEQLASFSSLYLFGNWMRYNGLSRIRVSKILFLTSLISFFISLIDIYTTNLLSLNCLTNKDKNIFSNIMIIFVSTHFIYVFISWYFYIKQLSNGNDSKRLLFLQLFLISSLVLSLEQHLTLTALQVTSTDTSKDKTSVNAVDKDKHKNQDTQEQDNTLPDSKPTEQHIVGEGENEDENGIEKAEDKDIDTESGDAETESAAESYFSIDSKKKRCAARGYDWIDMFESLYCYIVLYLEMYIFVTFAYMEDDKYSKNVNYVLNYNNDSFLACVFFFWILPTFISMSLSNLMYEFSNSNYLSIKSQVDPIWKFCSMVLIHCEILFHVFMICYYFVNNLILVGIIILLLTEIFLLLILMFFIFFFQNSKNDYYHRFDQLILCIVSFSGMDIMNYKNDTLSQIIYWTAIVTHGIKPVIHSIALLGWETNLNNEVNGFMGFFFGGIGFVIAQLVIIGGVVASYGNDSDETKFRIIGNFERQLSSIIEFESIAVIMNFINNSSVNNVYNFNNVINNYGECRGVLLLVTFKFNRYDVCKELIKLNKININHLLTIYKTKNQYSKKMEWYDTYIYSSSRLYNYYSSYSRDTITKHILAVISSECDNGNYDNKWLRLLLSNHIKYCLQYNSKQKGVDVDVDADKTKNSIHNKDDDGKKKKIQFLDKLSEKHGCIIDWQLRDSANKSLLYYGVYYHKSWQNAYMNKENDINNDNDEKQQVEQGSGKAELELVVSREISLLSDSNAYDGTHGNVSSEQKSQNENEIIDSNVDNNNLILFKLLSANNFEYDFGNYETSGLTLAIKSKYYNVGAYLLENCKKIVLNRTIYDYNAKLNKENRIDAIFGLCIDNNCFDIVKIWIQRCKKEILTGRFIYEIFHENDKHISYMIDAIESGNVGYKWDILENCDLVKNHSCLTLCAHIGNVDIFRLLVHRYIRLNNIDNWSKLKFSKIAQSENIKLLIKIAGQNSNHRIEQFLSSLLKVGVQSQDFDIFCQFLGISGSGNGNINAVNVDSVDVKDSNDNNDEDNNGNGDNLDNEQSELYLANNKVAEYIFEKCDNDTLNKLSDIINNGLLNLECGFNDSLLLLSSMIDKERLFKTLEITTMKCLTNEYKTPKSYQFFKQNLLNSQIWASKVSTSSNGKFNKNNSNNTINSIANDKILFDRVQYGIIMKELNQQKEYIKENIDKMEKLFESEWKKLLNIKTRTFDSTRSASSRIKYVKLQQPIKPKYEARELPFDNVNGFDGTIEYDYNGYLTDLMIAANVLDKQFQLDCEKIFQQKPFVDKCQFTR